MWETMHLKYMGNFFGLHKEFRRKITMDDVLLSQLSSSMCHGYHIKVTMDKAPYLPVMFALTTYYNTDY